jgi:hypothetical protein
MSIPLFLELCGKIIGKDLRGVQLEKICVVYLNNNFNKLILNAA